MLKNKKIGVSIITADRSNYLSGLLDSIDTSQCGIDRLIVVDDGKKASLVEHSKVDAVYRTSGRIGVGKAKNIALKNLYENKCDYIFLIEDDMVILDPTVFKQYIEASKITGIQHFNFGPGSPFNKKQSITNFDLHNRHLLREDTEPNPKLIVDYNNIKISLYEHITGMFSFFTRKVLDDVGFIDEKYHNAWEHVDHTYQIIKAGYHPPFWWFADLHNSHLLIESQKDSIANSTTSKNTNEWMANIQKNAELYKQKNKHYPAQTPVVTQDNVIKVLKKIKTHE
jgi:GT2 family glycosyltransferase